MGVLPIPRSLRAGGCTFPEDPALSCACVRPIWSAAVDPCVLKARAASAPDETEAFDLRDFATRVVTDAKGEHVRIDGLTGVTRLDITAGTLTCGPVALRFEVDHDRRLPAQLGAIRSCFDMTEKRTTATRRHSAQARKLVALGAIDLRMAGASLREIADALLGDGDWPGDGEHRKSVVRRLITAGERIVRVGHRAVLSFGASATGTS